MVLRTKCMTRRIAVGACTLVLTFLLAACGSASSSSASQAASGNKSSYTLTVTPTTHESTSLTPTTTVSMKTYTGNGFSIDYPQGWKVTSSGPEVAFTDPSGSYDLTIGVSANANDATTADQLANSGLSSAKSNLKDVETVSIPQTVTLASQTWSRRGLTGINTYQGQSTPVQVEVLATNHPDHTTATKGYIIAYVALKDKFDQAKTQYFTPMLESFKFAA